MLIVQSSPKLYLTTAVFAAVTFGSLGPSDAASPRFLDQSLASQLVQSMTQRRILQTDDMADANCKSRSFEQARVVHQPVMAKHDGYTTKSWQEDWTLNRCGADVFYRVFYSEIGAGGVTLSIAPLDSAGTPVIEPVVASAPSAPLLRLTKPFMRGDDVKALQVALNKADVKVSTDGVFGPGTKKAVAAFQKKKGLKADGEVGSDTRKALGL